MSKRVAAERLRGFCEQVLATGDLDAEDAATVADVLVTTDSWGTYSHGTGALRHYLNAIRAGGIDPHAKPEIAAEGDSWAIIDGRGGMGMVGSCLAVKIAIEKARGSTIAWTGVRNSSHFGAAGYYANMAAAQNMLGIAMSNADPNMVVQGARGRVIGNNPLSYAVPAGEEDPILLDIALSAVAASKILAKKALGLQIPSTWLADEEGVATETIGDWPLKGSMLPMAEYKGYGIALLVEVFAGLLTGAGALDEAKSWLWEPAQKASLGQSFVVVNIDEIIPIQAFKARVDAVIRKLRNSPKAKGSERVYVPGEMEWERRRDALEHGIPLPALTVASLRTAGQEAGVDTSFLSDEP